MKAPEIGLGTIELRPLPASAFSLLAVLVLGSCGATVVKPQAFDHELLVEPWFAARLRPTENKEHVVDVGASWLDGVGSEEELTFAGYRDADGVRYCVVLECDPSRDLLVLWPLPNGESPVESLANPTRRRELEDGSRRLLDRHPAAADGLIRVSLEQVIAERRLVSPIPAPRRIYAVAANYPSHLEHDLAVDEAGEQRESVRRAQPRVFVKYPPVPPPGSADQEQPHAPYSGLVGPFEPVVYPARIVLPGEEDGRAPLTDTALDYEVEIGVVLGRSLTWEAVETMDDDALQACVVGTLLVSDIKARNPQVVNKIANRENGSALPEEASRHVTGHGVLDKSLGDWDRITCHWWSYASSCGDFASIGPFLEATDSSGQLGSHAMMSARTYGPESVRAQAIPKRRREDVFYLRQFTRTTEDQSYEDALFWGVPQIIRSILQPGSALDFGTEPPRLERGDVISLGTPGGTVITSRPQFVVDLLVSLFCWWDPVDFHDAFFDGTMPLYLHHGDRVFFWAEGLGCQHHGIQRDSFDDPGRATSPSG